MSLCLTRSVLIIPFVLAKIKDFVEQHRANKIILATGDAKQLSPTKALTNTKKNEMYMHEFFVCIFPHHLFLEECKRLKTQEDKDKLKNIYADIFEHQVPLLEFINKYFKYTGDRTGTESNIAYLNGRGFILGCFCVFLVFRFSSGPVKCRILQHFLAEL